MKRTSYACSDVHSPRTKNETIIAACPQSAAEYYVTRGDWPDPFTDFCDDDIVTDETFWVHVLVVGGDHREVIPLARHPPTPRCYLNGHTHPLHAWVWATPTVKGDGSCPRCALTRVVSLDGVDRRGGRRNLERVVYTRVNTHPAALLKRAPWPLD